VNFQPAPVVGEIVGRTPAACRKLASSARRRIREADAPTAPNARQSAVVRSFKHAFEAGDIDALVYLLDPAATGVADGGGLATAKPYPIVGAEQMARACLDIVRRNPDISLLERTVNGQPGLVDQRDSVIVTVFAFHIAGDRIRHIWAVRNPEKLRAWATT
jgi:hypothetical protein